MDMSGERLVLSHSTSATDVEKDIGRLGTIAQASISTQREGIFLGF